MGATLIFTFYLYLNGHYGTFEESFRVALFQTTALSSSTGYGTADFLLWGPFAHVLIIVLMVVGGSAGSTAGGIKCVRAMLMLKQGGRELKQLIHPNAVISLKLGKESVSGKVTRAVFGFFFLYSLTLAVSSLALGAMGVDIVTAISATISSLSNIGPGLGEVGPASNYAALPDAAKLLLSFCMIVGRLEILTVFVLFLPDFWK